MSQPPSVLIVDDDPGVTYTFARMLQMSGFSVSTASNAETGLRQVAAMHPDAVVVDLRMPLVDGLGFVQQLRARERRHQTPVAVVTGDYFVADSVSRALLDMNVLVYFKPLWLADLLRIAEGLVEPTRQP